jgi:uncharacterized RmlC-like cupin family protein
MANNKYDKYFVTDVVKENKWGGEGISLGNVPEEIIPPNAKISLGVTAVRKPYMFHEPTHKHTFTEYFFFFGSNPTDMHQFDAEVEFSFGEEREKHIVTSPTIITAIPGVYHCPLNYARVFQPFYCLEAFLTPKYEGTNLEEKPAAEAKPAEAKAGEGKPADEKPAPPKPPEEKKYKAAKYDRYVTRDLAKVNKWGGEGIGLGAVPDDVVPPNAKMSLAVTVVRTPYMFHEPTHKHTFTEFFLFFGSNPMNLHEFDGEAEYYFGEEHEKHIISQPTVVVIPPGVYHCPLNYAKIGKPFYCVEAFLTPKYEGTNLEPAK